MTTQAAKTWSVGAAMTTRPATSTASRGRCSGSRPERLTIREAADVTRCQSVAERLRRRGGAEAWLSMDEIVEPDRERRNGNGMPAGLEAGLGFLLGIELAEGEGGE